MVDRRAIQEDVTFDWGAAASLADELRSTAAVLEFQLGHRDAARSAARELWQGPYGDEFDDRVAACRDDAERFASSMRSAADQLDELAHLAREEQHRREQAREWVASQDDDGGDGFGIPGVDQMMDVPGDMFGGLHDMAFGEDVPPDLMPQDPPSILIADPGVLARETVLGMARHIQDRGGVSSASPNDLDTWVGSNHELDETISRRKVSLEDSHAEFTCTLGWGGFDASSLFAAVGTWLSYNATDRSWVANIAQTFREAGSGTVLNPLIGVNLAATGLGAPLVGTPLELLRRELEEARASGRHPCEYAELLNLYWLMVATENAGIDLSEWHPSLRAEEMLPYVAASYRRYGQLYLQNPDFQWAGMAGMVGPTLAGYMLDLHMVGRFSDVTSTALDALQDRGGDTAVLAALAKEGLTANMPFPLGDLEILDQASEESGYFENSLLNMQRQIFTDQIPMHEAYMVMGMDGIEEMRQAELIDDRMVNAWQDIDSGDPDRVRRGNEHLLWREQHEVIGDDYVDMGNHHGVVGQTMTHVIGAIAAPGIPGAQSLGEYDPLTIEVPLGPGLHPRVEIDTRFPAGNIADADTRWGLLKNDMLPKLYHLIENDPERIEKILRLPVDERIDETRLRNKIDEIHERLVDWRILPMSDRR